MQYFEFIFWEAFWPAVLLIDIGLTEYSIIIRSDADLEGERIAAAWFGIFVLLLIWFTIATTPMYWYVIGAGVGVYLLAGFCWYMILRKAWNINPYSY